jgi:hypothetical protein
MPRSETAFVVLLAIAAACAEERAGGDAAPGQGVHPAGFLDPDSDAFHGAELARRGWDLALCASCHGEDFGGGAAQVSCRDCHEDGPTACDTCHGDPPSSGAHPTHLARFACATCHVVPATWDAAGHVLGDEPPADVSFAGLAAGGGYDGDACGVYCHGEARPRWRGGPDEAACGTCHGAPPATADHAYDTCATCHPNGARHVDGSLDVGTACNGCHGTDADGAPPRDLAGNLFTSARGVGAHQAHLTVPFGLSRPIACATCHAVPADVSTPGHIDTPWPAEVATPVGWNGASCSNACHGTSTPIWTAQEQVFCGSCHGIPPEDDTHDPELTQLDCVDCHPASVDAFGRVDPSAHLDGDVDVAP